MSLLHCHFGGEYDLELSAWGEGRLRDEELSTTAAEAFARYREEYNGDPFSVSLFIEDTLSYGLDYGFTSIDPAFLEQLENLRELILPDSITELEVTPKIREIFKNNNTLIRGTFDSFAERFAAEQGLHFRHSDFVIARYFYEPASETTVMTLVFHRDGSIQAKQDVSSPGSSAGNCFGGTFWTDLPRDFYRQLTVEQVADMLPMTGRILSMGRLAQFMEKVKDRKIFTGKN
ncbi:MAG: hypothetical protein IKN17_13530 [Ruminococcus sp.]|nr:hypothetical protein [Ruminococcus sp.]